MSWSWWVAWKDAGRPFFAGFFEGPRLWSTGEPLRDDLVWLPASAEQAPDRGEEPAAAFAPGGVDDAPAAQLVSLMTGLGESIRPRDGQ